MTAQHNTTTYLFAGGGTGGHIFPAIAIAEELLARGTGARCRFLVSGRELDAKILRGQALMVDGHETPPEFDVIPAQPFGVRPRALVRFLNSWGKSVRAARRIIRAAKHDSNVVMVAMGGFVAAPCVQAARAEKVPVVLVNLDAVPGKANRWIARHANEIVTAAPIASHLVGDSGGGGGGARSGTLFANWQQIAPIVRRGAAWSGSKREARIELGLDPDRPTLMITGGSQGADTINAFMMMFLTVTKVNEHSLAGEGNGGWQVLHQVGQVPKQIEGSTRLDIALRARYKEHGVQAIIEPFVDNLGAWWGASDLAICRAGAGNVGEVWANKVPAIFMPYPFHKDEHQKFNARALEQSGGALVLKDQIATPNLYSVGPVLASLLNDPVKRTEMRAALEKLGPADGAARAAEVISMLAQPS